MEMAKVLTMQLVEGSSERLNRFRCLLDVTLALNAEQDPDLLLAVILDAATKVANCDAASILLYEERTSSLRFVAANGPKADGLVGMMVPTEGSLAGTVYKEDRILFASDVREESTHFEGIDSATGYQTRTLLGVPMRIGGETVGVLEVLNPHSGEFGAEEAQAMVVVAAQAAVALRNARNKQLRDQLNAQLVELDELKNDFLAITSHELRTPLTSVRGFGQILSEEVADDLQPYAKAVLRAGYRMTDVVETLDVMASLRGERGSHPGRLVDLNEIIKDVVQATDRSLHVELPDPIYVEGHGPRLRLMINNLIKNASQFSSPELPVFLHGAISGTDVHIRVIDQGRGIESKNLERIFEAYVQVANSIRRDHEGLGVGLTVARAIAVQHGGSMWAESDGLGQGATFHLRLPLTDY